VEWQLLEGVPAADVQRLIQVARRRTFRRREVVFHRGDPADSLHLVSKGRFAVRVMTPLGDQAMIAVRGPGESFGEMALVGEKAGRAATVEALEEAETLCVYEKEFARLRHEHPAEARRRRDPAERRAGAVSVASFLLVPITPLGPRLIHPATYTPGATRPRSFGTVPVSSSKGTPGRATPR